MLQQGGTITTVPWLHSRSESPLPRCLRNRYKLVPIWHYVTSWHGLRQQLLIGSRQHVHAWIVQEHCVALAEFRLCLSNCLAAHSQIWITISMRLTLPNFAAADLRFRCSRVHLNVHQDQPYIFIVLQSTGKQC